MPAWVSSSPHGFMIFTFNCIFMTLNSIKHFTHNNNFSLPYKISLRPVLTIPLNKKVVRASNAGLWSGKNMTVFTFLKKVFPMEPRMCFGIICIISLVDQPSVFLQRNKYTILLLSLQIYWTKEAHLHAHVHLV